MASRGSTPRLSPRLAGTPEQHEVVPSEEDPLLGVHESVRVYEFEMQENIYGFITVFPELYRVKSGGYFNAKVGIAFALILLNILLQVSLTMIAGNSIMTDLRTYKESLTQFPAMELPIEDEQLGKVDVSTEIKGLLGAEEKKTEACCVGHACSTLHVKCCQRRVGNATGLVPLNFMQLGKLLTEPSSTHRASSLCQDNTHNGGSLDCSPKSYMYMNQFELLDSNGDGIWTEVEADADAANLGCKLGVSASEVFRAVQRGLRDFAHDVQKEPMPSELTSVTQHQFQHWRGMVAMCSAVDTTRCSALIEQGVFDGAFKVADTAPRDGVTSVEKALDYCQQMLMPGGICEKALPVTYMIYRQQVHDKCGAASFTSGQIFTNPHNKRDVMRMVSIEYPELDKYTMAEGYTFQFFVCLILIIWYVNMIGELQSIIQLADFAWNFPNAEGADPLGLSSIRKRLKRVSRATTSTVFKRADSEASSKEGSVMRDAEATTIKDICTTHRLLLAIVIFLRIWLMLYMALVGTIFLLGTYSYADLLMNAVALAFVFELPEFLYMLLVHHSDKNELMDVGSLEYETSMPECKGLIGYFMSIYFLGLAVFPAMCVGILAWNHWYTIMPIYEALQCACLQEGPKCLAKETLSRSWWNEQWALPPL